MQMRRPRAIGRVGVAISLAPTGISRTVTIPCSIKSSLNTFLHSAKSILLQKSASCHFKPRPGITVGLPCRDKARSITIITSSPSYPASQSPIIRKVSSAASILASTLATSQVAHSPQLDDIVDQQFFHRCIFSERRSSIFVEEKMSPVSSTLSKIIKIRALPFLALSCKLRDLPCSQWCQDASRPALLSAA